MKNYKCKYCNRIFNSGNALGGHTINCKLNPNKYICSDEHRKRLSISLKGKGHPQTEESKLKISRGMKKAIKEGRAFGWKNHHMLKNSYAEDFFIKVIHNEFDNKNYIKEYRIGKYSIDFAWPDLNLAIEIDGSQHEYPERKRSDKLKDQFLKENGWKVLRIKWKDIFKNTKKYIKLAKNFIDNAEFA